MLTQSFHRISTAIGLQAISRSRGRHLSGLDGAGDLFDQRNAGSGSPSWPRTLACALNSQSLCMATLFVATGRPTASVPLLPNTTASAQPALPELRSTLDHDAAALAMAITVLIAVGLAKSTAHGQAITRMVIARRTSPMLASVIAEAMNDVGTKRREKFSPTV